MKFNKLMSLGGGTIGLVLIIFNRGFGLSFLLGLGLVVSAGWLWIRGDDSPTRTTRENALDYRAIMMPFKFKQIGKYSAIALDADNGVLHLYPDKNYRAYPFSEIRRWSTNIQTGQAGSIAQLRDMQNATGLFIEVRDVDFPKWRIHFPAKGLEQSLARWMEIFQQYVNEK